MNPNSSLLPDTHALDQLSGLRHEQDDLANAAKSLWVDLQLSQVSLKYRDALWQWACKAKLLALEGDALIVLIQAAQAHAAIAQADPLSVNWQESDPFATAPVPTIAGGANGL